MIQWHTVNSIYIDHSNREGLWWVTAINVLHFSGRFWTVYPLLYKENQLCGGTILLGSIFAYWALWLESAGRGKKASAGAGPWYASRGGSEAGTAGMGQVSRQGFQNNNTQEARLCDHSWTSWHKTVPWKMVAYWWTSSYTIHSEKGDGGRAKWDRKNHTFISSMNLPCACFCILLLCWYFFLLM